MYEAQIKRVGLLVAGKMDMRLAIYKVATEAGIRVGDLAREMRSHAHARHVSKKRLVEYRRTVPEFARE